MSDTAKTQVWVDSDEYVALLKDSFRYRWLCEHVVFLHQSFGERDPVTGPTKEWSIHGEWPGYKADDWFKSLDEAIEKAMGSTSKTTASR